MGSTPCRDAGYLEPAWLAYRVRGYLTYTLPSLLNQTDSDFRIWLDCRPGSEAELEPHLPVFDEVGVLVTFDRGKRCLADLPRTPTHCFVTRIDSDDCYASDAVELIREYQGKRRATQFTDGYVFEARQRYAYPITHRSPPFYTLRLQIDEQGLVVPPHAGHNSIRDAFNPLILPAGRYCMVRHGKQGDYDPLGRAPRWYRPGRPRRIRPGTEQWGRVAATFLVDPISFWEARGCPRALDLLWDEADASGPGSPKTTTVIEELVFDAPIHKGPIRALVQMIRSNDIVDTATASAFCRL